MKKNIEKISLLLIGFSGFFCVNSVTLMSVFLIFTLIAFLITVDKDKIEKIRKNTFFIPFLLLLSYILLQIIISNDKMNALKYTKGWWTVIYLFIIPLYVDNKKKRNLLMIFYLSGVFLGIIWGFYKYFTYYIDSESRLKGFGVGLLPFALFMGYGILIFTYFFISNDNYFILIPFTLTSLVVSFSLSIGPFISLFPGILIFLIYNDRKERFLKLILCFIILILSFLSVEKSVSKGLSYLDSEKITNARARKLYWKYSIYCFKKSPIIGVKTGDLYFYKDEFIKKENLKEWEIKHIERVINKSFHSHNFYIDTLGRMGIIGFIIITIFIFSFFYKGIYYFKMDRNTILLLSVLVFILFYSLTEDPFFKSDMAFPLYYLFGIYDNNKD